MGIAQVRKCDFARLLREADRNRPGAALSLAMVDRLNIIPLRVQHKSGIVTGDDSVVRRARRYHVRNGSAPHGKSVDHVTISGLGMPVVAPSQFPGSLRAVA